MNNNFTMNKADEQFISAICNILTNGVWDENPRPKWADGTPAYSKFTTQYMEEYDISKNEFPITTIKPTAWKTGIREMFWIYQEQSNDLDVARNKYGINWWDDWNVGDNTIGYRYGHTVKRFDLMNKLLNDIKNNPYGRRHIISLWQEEEFIEDIIGLNPCAFQTLWSVRNGYLDCTLIQRSNDVIAAYNINNVQYVALMMMVAHHCGLKPGKFVRFVQNIHIYDRHMIIAEKFIDRNISYKQPKLIFEPKSDNFYDFTINDFSIVDYEPYENINIEIAI